MKRICSNRRTRHGVQIILILLALYLLGVGTAYSSWADRTSVDFRMATGKLGLIFPDSPDQAPVQACITDAQGKNPEKIPASELHYVLDYDKKSLQFSLDQVLLTDDFRKHGKMLMFQYTIIGDEANTINDFKRSSAAFKTEPEEHLVFTPKSSRVRVSGKEYELPEDVFDQLPPLSWEVYRQTETQSDKGRSEITVMVYLKPSPDVTEGSFLPEEFPLHAEELPAELISDLTAAQTDPENAAAALPEKIEAEIDITYSFELPLWVEQKH
ncbi:hypothetical protein QBE55_02550 [Eubacteriales bacterium mix99]